jgi:hypothetical protein
MTFGEAVSAHIQSLLEDSSALENLVGTSIAKGRLSEDQALPGVVHSIISAPETHYAGSNAGTDPKMANGWVDFQLRADDIGDSYALCYDIIEAAQAAIMVSSRQGDKTVHIPVPTVKLERELPDAGERYPSVIAEYRVLVAQTVGVGA